MFFTIKNGSRNYGINAYNANYPVFKNLILENNPQYDIPGNATVENSLFRNNTGEILVIRSSTEPYGCVFKNVTIAGNNDFRFRIQHQAPANPIDDYTDVFFFNSVFWDYDDDNMNYLTLPNKQPEYRGNRSHDEFLVRLKDHYGSGAGSGGSGSSSSMNKHSLFKHVKSATAQRFELEEMTLKDVLQIANDKFGGLQQWVDTKCRTKVVKL